MLLGIEAQLDQSQRVRIGKRFYLLLELLLDYHFDSLGVHFLGVGFAVAAGIFALHAVVFEDVGLGELILRIGSPLVEEERPDHLQHLTHSRGLCSLAGSIDDLLRPPPFLEGLQRSYAQHDDDHQRGLEVEVDLCESGVAE